MLNSISCWVAQAFFPTHFHLFSCTIHTYIEYLLCVGLVVDFLGYKDQGDSLNLPNIHSLEGCPELGSKCGLLRWLKNRVGVILGTMAFVNSSLQLCTPFHLDLLSKYYTWNSICCMIGYFRDQFCFVHVWMGRLEEETCVLGRGWKDLERMGLKNIVKMYITELWL